MQAVHLLIDGEGLAMLVFLKERLGGGGSGSRVRSRMNSTVRYSVHLEMAMRQATFTEMRNHAKQYLDMVESGESVRVLRNGKPIADIVPVLADLLSWKRRKAQPMVLGFDQPHDSRRA